MKILKEKWFFRVIYPIYVGLVVFLISEGLVYLKLGPELHMLNGTRFQPLYTPAQSMNVMRNQKVLDELFGQGPTLAMRIENRRRNENGIIWHVAYTTDFIGRRVGHTGDRKKEKYLAFFGCSYIFGTGVNDNETTPYYLEELLPNYRTYNYGVGGFGAHQVLAMVQNYNLVSQISEKQGAAIYVWIDAHLDRMIGTMNNMQGRPVRAPNYELENGTLVRRGDLVDGTNRRKWLNSLYTPLFIAKEKSRFLKFFGFELPPFTHAIPYYQELSRKVVEEIFFQLKSKLGTNDLVFVLLPVSDFAKKYLVQGLIQKGVRVLDYTDLFDQDTNRSLRLRDDPHPNALAYKMIAQRLAHDLSANVEKGNL